MSMIFGRSQSVRILEYENCQRKGSECIDLLAHSSPLLSAEMHMQSYALLHKIVLLALYIGTHIYVYVCVCTLGSFTWMLVQLSLPPLQSPLQPLLLFSSYNVYESYSWCTELFFFIWASIVYIPFLRMNLRFLNSPSLISLKFRECMNREIVTKNSST